jgi:hypothetical protein
VALDRHKKLVLDVRNARRERLVFAPALKTAQRDAEIKQLLEIFPGELGHRHLPKIAGGARSHRIQRRRRARGATAAAIYIS